MTENQKEDTHMDQLHNFLQNILPRVAKTYNLDITTELESLRSKFQISTDKEKCNSSVDMLLANRLKISRWIKMMTLVTKNPVEVEMVSRATLSNNRKERFQIRQRIWHKHYDQSIPADYGGGNFLSSTRNYRRRWGKQKIHYAKQSSLQGMEHDYHYTTFQTTDHGLATKSFGTHTVEF